ncbi:uncharacterized protein EI97DRAFT_435102 [Westerdykella ornata]|uniref:GST N-terminal domain-containing protein n=1 Tax=Westerdykella ornata TaxID=318751 RepID=A0A6A6JEG8_WESOR|nr:uncharacterized protein EI97DRAFT_435102 [Westerdykella ornata]KAF2274563.1 hypothetical protein EI97DRAFT_435102 [Westerdykella ornata]
MAQVTLYDIPTREPRKGWSLNPWKPRMVLNYKGIDYKTEWTEYPDIDGKFRSFGITPHDRNDPSFLAEYTSPVVRFDDGTFVMDSWNIAHEIEKRYPTPSLGLDEPIVVQIKEFISKLFVPLAAEILPKIPRNLLSAPSAEYFERTRAAKFGMSLTQFEKEKGGDKAWEAAEAPVKELAGILKKNGGPYFLGDRVTYADFILVTFLEFLKRIGDGLYEKFTAFDPAFEKLYDASKQWLNKDD